MNNPSRPHPRTRRTFRPTGVGSFTAKSSHPFDESFFADLDARLAWEELRAAPSLRVPASASLSPAATRRA